MGAFLRRYVFSRCGLTTSFAANRAISVRSQSLFSGQNTKNAYISKCHLLIFFNQACRGLNKSKELKSADDVYLRVMDTLIREITLTRKYFPFLQVAALKARTLLSLLGNILSFQSTVTVLKFRTPKLLTK